MATALVTQIAYAVQTLFDPAGTAGRLVDLGKLANYGLLTSFTPGYLFTSGVNGTWYDPSDINLTWRRNLLTYTEQFDNVVWDKTSFPVMITADVIAAPNGTNTVDLVVPTAASAAHAVRQTGLSVGTSTSFSVYAKSAGYDRVQLYLQNVGGFGHITFSLASGTVTNTVSGSLTVTGSITSAGNGWYLLSVAGTGATAVSTVGISPLDAGANGATLVPTYTGDGTSGIYIWGAQLELGSTATPYQRITDGVQDYLQYQAQPVLYRDAAGTQPVTVVEQPVGLMKDKSGRGNHAFNSSGNSANFPVLSARYNLLTKTEDFSDAVWTKQAGTTVSSTKVTAPDGTLTAFSVTGNGTSGIHQAITGTLSLGQSVRSVYLRVPTGTATVGIKDPVLTQGTTTCNLTTSWQRFTLTETTPSSGGFVAGIWIFNIPASGIEVAWPDTRSVNDALNQPAYQRVNTSTDYDTVGFKPYLRFNGVSQWLQTNSIDFSYGDKMFVCAGVRKLSDATSGAIAELSTGGSVGSFLINAPSNVGNSDYQAVLYGNGTGIQKATSFAAPITNFIAASYNFAGAAVTDEISIRVNGAAPTLASSGTPSTTAAFGNYPLYIGAREGTSLWFNGRLYGMVVAGKPASAAEITATESFINQKTGAY